MEVKEQPAIVQIATVENQAPVTSDCDEESIRVEGGVTVMNQTTVGVTQTTNGTIFPCDVANGRYESRLRELIQRVRQLLYSQPVHVWSNYNVTSETSFTSLENRETPPGGIQQNSISTFTDRQEQIEQQGVTVFADDLVLHRTDGFFVVDVESAGQNETEVMSVMMTNHAIAMATLDQQIAQSQEDRDDQLSASDTLDPDMPRLESSDIEDDDVPDLVDTETGDDKPDLIDDDGGEMQSQLVDTIRHWRTWKMDQWGRYVHEKGKQFQMGDHNIRFTTIDNDTFKLEGEVKEPEDKDGLDHNFRHATEIQMDTIPTIATEKTVVAEDQNFRHAASMSSTPSN